MRGVVMKHVSRCAEQTQMALIPLDEELVLRKARELFDSSRVLSARWPSFQKALADPNVGRCLRLSATQLLRRAEQGKGRRH
jgi:hypothetical protein